MSRKVLVVLIVLCSIGAKAQSGQDYVRSSSVDNTITSQDKKYSLSLQIGPAIPIGDFASTNVKGSFWDFSSPDSTRLQGFAKPGFHFDFSLTYYVYDYFGIALMIGDNINTLDLAAFSATMGYPATASTTTYYTGEYLIGPVFSFSLTNKLKMNASILGGFIKNDYPELTLFFNDTITYTRNISSGNFSFAYYVGLGFVYNINDFLDVTASVSYTAGTVHYPNWTETLQANSTNPNSYVFLPNTIVHSNDVTGMAIGLIKPCIGIALKF